MVKSAVSWGLVSFSLSASSFFFFFYKYFDRQYNICHHHKLQDMYIIHCPILKLKKEEKEKKQQQRHVPYTYTTHV